jgi:carbonic anhydrase/acetyltransferase-like protein (isoleucine patch superfamily)
MDSLNRQLDTFLRAKPRLGAGVYIAKTAVVLGDVRIGDHSNIQDNAVLHLADEFPCIVGNYVTVGHSAIVHACTVGNEVLIGMGATILDGAVVGDQCLIGANALVTQGAKIPAGSMVLGSPARVVRVLKPEERAKLKWWADKYVENTAYCLKHGINVGGPLET